MWLCLGPQVGAVCQNIIVSFDDTVFSLLYWWLQLGGGVLAPKSVCCFSMLPLSLIPTLFYLCLFAVLLDSKNCLLLLLSNAMKGAFITICLQIKGENGDK